MKRIFAIAVVMMSVVSIMKAGDRPVTFAQLPVSAQTFITQNFPEDKISYATVDDDLILPDYNVVLVSGMRIQFEHNGALEKISSVKGVPVALIPVQIKDYVNAHYPDATFVDYEIGRRSYEVKLSNRMELKFNRNFILVEIDD